MGKVVSLYIILTLQLKAFQDVISPTNGQMVSEPMVVGKPNKAHTTILEKKTQQKELPMGSSSKNNDAAQSFHL
jgi:hypothetical protein